MQVTFDKSVAPSLLEGGYSYTPSGNSTIAVEFDNDGRDVYDILEDAGLGHLTDEIIYTNYYADCLLNQAMQRMWQVQTSGRVPTI